MDAHGLALLIQTHAAALVLFARTWCDCAEDVVQEAFVKLTAQQIAPEDPVAWLYRVVRNGALSAARAQRRRRHHERTKALGVPTWFQRSEDSSLDLQAVTQALQELPTELREPLVAHLWGQRTFDQIGVLMGVSSSTAHRRYLEGLEVLRQRLGVPCPSNP